MNTERWINIAAPVRDAMQIAQTNANFTLDKLVMIVGQIKKMERETSMRELRIKQSLEHTTAWFRDEFKKQRAKTDEGLNQLNTMVESRIRKNNEQTTMLKENMKVEFGAVKTNLANNYRKSEPTMKHINKLVDREILDLNNRMTVITKT